jgi:hypothetical protein
MFANAKVSIDALVQWPRIFSVSPTGELCNHELKDVFKAAATAASACEGVFREFYLGLLWNPPGRRWQSARSGPTTITGVR